MRKAAMIIMCAALVATATPAFAELQNVQVGGSIQIRANYYSNVVPNGNVPGALANTQVIWPNFFLPNRPIGTGAFNGLGITSGFSWDEDDSTSLDFVEQRTRLNVKADFTNEVSAFIEIDSYDIWGTDFRSNYITGVDGAAVSTDDVEIYQAYIEANEMWGFPLRARIGRQELSFGSEWLVGVNDTASFFQGLSFDGLRLTYGTDVFSVDAFVTTLAEGGAVEEDEDVTFSGIYGSYKGLEEITIDAYWFWLRDARSLNDTNFVAPIEWLEDIFSLDDYDVTNLHTVGLRGAGTIGAFDFEAEAAFQFGDSHSAGFLFKPFLYGDDGSEYDAWGANLEVGYTFDIAWSPRVYLGGAYFDGEDDRDISFLEWVNPFDRAEASVSFNRLFSNWEYSEFIENTDLSNAYVLRGGVSVQPTESIEALLAISYFKTLEEFDEPVNFSVGGFKVPLAPALSFWTEENDAELGWEAALYVTYHYSEDLSFQVGWAHLFVGDGLQDGQFSAGNGLLFNGGTSDDDADYIFIETKLCF
ncbi:MAG TPA: alginate export family protein [Candidatus Hydrogenedentes bacterium]|nr:alginate export family protein [Candidatus Hydrogenedentota bacterium]